MCWRNKTSVEDERTESNKQFEQEQLTETLVLDISSFEFSNTGRIEHVGVLEGIPLVTEKSKLGVQCHVRTVVLSNSRYRELTVYGGGRQRAQNWNGERGEVKLLEKWSYSSIDIISQFTLLKINSFASENKEGE